MSDVLISYISVDGGSIVLPTGKSTYCSIQPLLIRAGSTSIIHARNLYTGFITTVIGSYVNNVRHMREGLDRVNNRPLADGIGSGPSPSAISLIEELRYRGNVLVDESILQPGDYEISVIVIIDPDIFLDYCEAGINGTSERVCGSEIVRRLEERQYQCQLEWYLFHISINIFVNIVLIILIIIIILLRSNKL